MEIEIRPHIPQYMAELKAWLKETREVPLEQMDGFFTKRISGYEEHMRVWKEAYQAFPSYLPPMETLLDLGCGTGLELDEIWKRFPDVHVTGVDLCAAMLEKLKEKHGEKRMKLVLGDYFTVDLGENKFDCAVSFESLHHFSLLQKKELYGKIFRALKPGGAFFNCDYIACCREEERLLSSAWEERREKARIPEHALIHFDTPLTLDHELQAMREGGFQDARPLFSIQGATLVAAAKGA